MDEAHVPLVALENFAPIDAHWRVGLSIRRTQDPGASRGAARATVGREPNRPRFPVHELSARLTESEIPVTGQNRGHWVLVVAPHDPYLFRACWSDSRAIRRSAPSQYTADLRPPLCRRGSWRARPCRLVFRPAGCPPDETWRPDRLPGSLGRWRDLPPAAAPARMEGRNPRTPAAEPSTTRSTTPNGPGFSSKGRAPSRGRPRRAGAHPRRLEVERP